MNDTPTPMTNALLKGDPSAYNVDVAKLLDLSRQLERELAAARERADINGRDWRRQCLKSEDLRSERDALAEALRHIRTGYGGQAAAPDCCEDCDFLIPPG